MSARVPPNRADAAGNLRALQADCAATMAGEMRNADFFAFAFDDLVESVREYAPHLTDAELARCFKAAQRRAA